MKPKNKFQKAVLEASKSLNPLTEAQRKSAIRKALPHLAKCNARGECHCLECGGFWKKSRKDKSEKVVCPHCGTKLEVEKSKRRRYNFKDYFGVVQRHKEFQVVRTYLIDVYMYRGYPAKYYIHEVFQRWMDKSGRNCIIGRKRFFSLYIDNWDLHSGMEIRREQYVYTLGPCCICGRTSVIPEIKRNGFKGNFQDMSPSMFFEAILTDSRMETMLKANQTEMFRHFAKSERGGLDKLWQSVKICIRNHYVIKDATLWLDLVSALEYCGKDIHNPKFICPTDLHTAHDHWIRKREEKQARERVERERERYFADLKQRKKDETAYRKSKGKFFGIAISDGIICIKVLDSVKAFYEEGAFLHHCVASNKYYNKAKSLILSATIDGKPIETIEISLDTFEILQCRGRYNQNSEHHERIMSLMKANINQIAKRMAS